MGSSFFAPRMSHLSWRKEEKGERTGGDAKRRQRGTYVLCLRDGVNGDGKENAPDEGLAGGGLCETELLPDVGRLLSEVEVSSLAITIGEERQDTQRGSTPQVRGQAVYGRIRGVVSEGWQREMGKSRGARLDGFCRGREGQRCSPGVTMEQGAYGNRVLQPLLMCLVRAEVDLLTLPPTNPRSTRQPH